MIASSAMFKDSTSGEFDETLYVGFENGEMAELYSLCVSFHKAQEGDYPSWAVDTPAIPVVTKRTIAEISDGKLVFYETEFDNFFVSHYHRARESSYIVLEAYLENFFFKYAPNIYCLMSCDSKGCHNPSPHFYKKIFALAASTDIMAVVETLFKKNGAKFAMSAVLNGVTAGTGKRKTVLPDNLIADIKSTRVDSLLGIVQEAVVNGTMSQEEVQDLIDVIKAMEKFGLATPTQIKRITEDERTKMLKGLKLNKILRTVLNSVLLNSLRVQRDNIVYEGLRNAFFHYCDAIAMLPTGTKIPNVNDVERFHVITARNNSIMTRKRADEYREAIVRQRKLRWEDGDYIIRPPETEEELFNIGEQYNNCLPMYRDLIIDENKIVLSIFKAGEEQKCPDVTFEVTPTLDIVQVKTYNDEDVKDQAVLDLIAKWKNAKRYLLDNHATVFRERDER